MKFDEVQQKRTYEISSQKAVNLNKKGVKTSEVPVLK